MSSQQMESKKRYCKLCDKEAYCKEMCKRHYELAHYRKIQARDKYLRTVPPEKLLEYVRRKQYG